MKCRITLLVAILFIILFPKESMALTNLEIFAEMYHNETHFTSFEDYNVTTGNRYDYGINYYTRLEDNQLIAQVTKNGSGIPAYTYEIQESGFNTGYFYIIQIRISNNRPYADIGFRVWNGERWTGISQTGVIGTQIEGTDITKIGYPPEQPGDPSGYLDGLLVITEPPYNGYKVSTQKYWLQYRYGVPLSSGGAPGGASISGVGVVFGTHEVHSWYVDERGTEDESDDMVYKYYRAQVDLSEGINTITVTLDYEGETYQDIATIEYLTGVVDENGDGIDDRTLLPIGSDGSSLSPDGAPVLPENATIFDYVKYAVDSIIYVFAQIGLALKGLIGGIGDIGKILTGFFSFMPQPFTGIIILGMLIAIILRIFGR